MQACHSRSCLSNFSHRIWKEFQKKLGARPQFGESIFNNNIRYSKKTAKISQKSCILDFKMFLARLQEMENGEAPPREISGKFSTAMCDYGSAWWACDMRITGHISQSTLRIVSRQNHLAAQRATRSCGCRLLVILRELAMTREYTHDGERPISLHSST